MHDVCDATLVEVPSVIREVSGHYIYTLREDGHHVVLLMTMWTSDWTVH